MDKDFWKGTKGMLNRKNKRILVIAGLCSVAVLLAAFAAVEIIGSLTRKKIDTTEGLEIIKRAESAELVDIETRIQKMEDKEKEEQEALDARSTKEKFASAVVMGDSITDGFEEYDILNASSVVAEIGVELDELDEQLGKLREINPQVAFLSYGMNDIVATQGDVEVYIEQYKAVIKQIQSDLPNTKIFINSIFPVQQQEIDREPAYEKLEEYNEALREMCDKQQIAYLDNTDLVSEIYYEEDGIHLKPEFYPLWAERMAEVASL